MEKQKRKDKKGRLTSNPFIYNSKFHECLFCHHKFSQAVNLWVHISSVHGGKMPQKYEDQEKIHDKEKDAFRKHVESFHEDKKANEC